MSVMNIYSYHRPLPNESWCTPTKYCQGEVMMLVTMIYFKSTTYREICPEFQYNSSFILKGILFHIACQGFIYTLITYLPLS